MIRFHSCGGRIFRLVPDRRQVVLTATGVFLFLVAASFGHPASAQDKSLINGIGLTELTVYDQRPAPDGLNSGCPHVHAVSEEGYYIMSGAGRVELHDLEHGFRAVELAPDRYLQFPPGVLHRLVNTDHLVILVVMENAGLAEHGDARVYFGGKADADPAEYARLLALARSEGLEGALKRRDAAVRAYQGLMSLWTTDKGAYFAELRRFLDVHFKTAAALRKEFSMALESGPLAWGGRFRRRLGQLPSSSGDLAPLLHLPADQTTLGMCGLLRPVTNLEPIDRQSVSGPKR